MSRSHQEFVLDSDSDMRLLHGLGIPQLSASRD